MNCLHQARFRTAAIFAAALFASFSLAAQSGTNIFQQHKSFPIPTNLIPNLQPHSPVDFFRQLLSMPARDRENYLTNKPPEVRARILDKIREYLVLDPNERELRLRATELRWYLLPLLRDAPTNRPARLAAVPENLRELVGSRLEQWDALPDEFRREFLDNERTLRYFTHVDSTNAPDAGMRHDPDGEARWNALSENERQKITNQFNQFFELTPDEKQKTLATLSDAERAQMEKTLQTFDKLPPSQRFQCVRAFTEFAGMNPKDRAEFLKNAEHWSQMPPKERQAWRDLVAQVPQWPPMPMAQIMPPMPPKIQPRSHALVATNLN
ncbi:MAG TPA: DUF3106 domain-containing protein [Methylomirabilota bacterium]|nr:DUF3106 domain-containing protein [Methylomirabilota bacterium]